jgi:hypothetical protein
MTYFEMICNAVSIFLVTVTLTIVYFEVKEHYLSSKEIEGGHND